MKNQFLAKLQESERDHLASCVFWTSSADNVYSVSAVEQCWWLLEELSLGCMFMVTVYAHYVKVKYHLITITT